MLQVIKSARLTEDVQKTISGVKHDKLFVLTDENTYNLCLPLIESVTEIEQACKIVIRANDDNKSLENLVQIWKQLTLNGATRHSLLVNLGGGMITDMGGFAAATFKRGISYINIPTTLLGAVDAAVGGKTGINFEGFKNEIGAFYAAESTIISSDFFKTLSEKDILSGFAEMLKHALIHSQTVWEELLRFDVKNIDYDWLKDNAFSSVSIKEQVVGKDPYEHNIRKALNLGHTIGHAFESFALEYRKPVLHGYAIAWGLISELYLSHRVCRFPVDKLKNSVRFIVENYGLIDIQCHDYDVLYEILKHDKKNEGSQINFTLLSDIGEIEIDKNIDKKLIFESLDFYRDSVGL